MEPGDEGMSIAKFPEAGPPRLTFSKIDPTQEMPAHRAKWLRVNGMQTREDLRRLPRVARTPDRKPAGGGFAFFALVAVAALVLMGYATWRAAS